jgi:hypothetical protein
VYSDYGEDGAAAGFVFPRAYSSSMALQIGADRLLKRLRTERGITYGVDAPYTRLTPDVAHAGLIADAANGHAAEVRDEIVRVVEELGAAGPTPDELARCVEREERNLRSSGMELAWLQLLAETELMGAPPPTLEQWRDELAAVDEGAIASGMLAAREEMALCAPAGLPPPPPSRLPWGTRARAIPPMEGHVHRPRRRRMRRPRDRIVVGEEGISLFRHDGPIVTIRYADCAVVKVLDGGKHEVNSVDESWIGIDPSDIPAADEIIAALRRALPAWKFVPGP